VLRKGRFQRLGESLSVRAGDTLELRCKGTPVQWSVPAYLEEDNEGRLRYYYGKVTQYIYSMYLSTSM